MNPKKLLHKLHSQFNYHTLPVTPFKYVEIRPDSKLEMSGSNPLYFQILRRITSQLQNLDIHHFLKIIKSTVQILISYI